MQLINVRQICCLTNDPKTFEINLRKILTFNHLLKKTAKLLSVTFQPYKNVENIDLAQYLEETTKLKNILRLSHFHKYQFRILNISGNLNLKNVSGRFKY